VNWLNLFAKFSVTERTADVGEKAIFNLHLWVYTTTSAIAYYRGADENKRGHLQLQFTAVTDDNTGSSTTWATASPAATTTVTIL